MIPAWAAAYFIPVSRDASIPSGNAWEGVRNPLASPVHLSAAYSLDPS
jgi:hypothetical protein